MFFRATTLRLASLLSLSALALSACADNDTAGPLAPELAPSAQHGAVVVLFKDAAHGGHGSPAALSQAILGSSPAIAVLDQIGGAVLADASPAQVASLRADARVAMVEPVRTAKLDQTVATGNWALDRLDQPSLPLNSSYTNPYGTTAAPAGTGVRIYVFDTGLRLDHTQFTGRVMAGPDFLANPAGTVMVTNDCHGHGTLAASAAAGRTLGTAPGATVVPVRVMTCQGQGTSVDIVRGLDYVIAQKRAARTQPMVINMSLAFVGGSTVIDEAVRRAVAEQVPVVVSAGNSNLDACQQSPAREPLAITVGASMNTDVRASFSNFGSCVDAYAPGANVLGAHIGSPTMSALWNGTSAAAPYVAGLVAAFVGRNPTATAAAVSDAFLRGVSANKITSVPSGTTALAQAQFGALTTTTTTTPTTGGTTPTTGGTTPGNRAPVARFTASCARRLCQFNGSTSSDDKAVTAYSWNFAGQVAQMSSGATTSAQATNVRYTANGTYPVSLTVRDAEGLTHTTTMNVTAVDAAPVARITPVCDARLNCTFGGETSTDDGMITSYRWTFSNGQTAAVRSPVVRFSSPTPVTATLTVTDDANQTHTTTLQYQVAFQQPTASFTATCQGLTCTIDATASSIPAGIRNITMDLGNGAISGGANTRRVMTYAQPGTYTMRVTVEDINRQTATTTRTVTVTR